MNIEKKKTLGAWVTVEIYREIKRRATAEGLTVSVWTRNLIMKHLQANPRLP